MNDCITSNSNTTDFSSTSNTLSLEKKKLKDYDDKEKEFDCVSPILELLFNENGINSYFKRFKCL